MQFDRSKLEAVILRTCNACPAEKLGAVKLHKVLYFLDMLHYAQEGVPVTGATYRKRPFGPTCAQLLPALRDMEKERLLDIREVEYYGLRKKEYVPRETEKAGVLNDNEVALLDEVIEFVCERNTAKTISDYSHQLPWEMVEFGAVIPYETALMLYPVQVSPEAFEAAEDGAKEVEAVRSSNILEFPLLSSLRSRVRAEVGRT
ncbi:DUF4065 domain-containing protein [Sphingomonas koreensis]|uniref:DUF4065 domain-containing protein n=1 Tax=Sphingomonas koreensis TaxID=93064 RepID=A0A430G618_9SPHN|nr:Panacea domain-containing protein [Sphingomonas koreensis]RSY88025.1 DUF4065 domain-containing protein [Sphingomonas koreensis]